ncbi:MAG: hypothetical protein K2V38_03310 [Gemmataceae bacterium]|nr:hypothetical protein [Gemmataceae bacterium]
MIRYLGPNARIMMGFTLVIRDEGSAINPHNDNVDVEVTLDHGAKYAATYFTLQNIHNLMERYTTTGECANGLYFWSSYILIVRELTHEAIMSSVADLIESGDIEYAFERV